MSNDHNISKPPDKSTKLVVIGTTGYPVWERTRPGTDYLELDIVKVEDASGNLQEARRLRPGETVVRVRATGLARS
jgi:hypothetical protein